MIPLHMHTKIVNISCIIIKLSVITASLTFSSVFAAETIKRKVLIIDFTNINNSTNYQYLETSIPESFSNSLEKTKNFHILNRNTWKNEVADGKYSKKDSFNQKVALQLARQSNADVVIIGSFVAMDDQMQVFAKAIEVSSERPIIASTTLAPLDGNMFSAISKLTDEMSVEMNHKLPPIMSAVQNDNGADTINDGTKAYSKINSLIDSGLEKNFEQIQILSGKISESDKDSILNGNKKDAGMAFAVNWLVGFGIGSFIQGDTNAGLVTLLGELGAIGILGGGIATMGIDSTVAISLAITGTGVLLGFKIFEMIRPFVFADNYNKKLNQALKISFNVTPYFNLAENRNPVYGLALSTRF